MSSDLKFAFRQLVKSPGFALVAVLTLALGIGLSASSFSMANAFLLRNLPYPDADRLVRIFSTSRDTQHGGHAPANILDLRDTATSFSPLAIYSYDTLALGEQGQPAEQVQALYVTTDFFPAIGVQPTIGRAFAPGEDQPDKPLVVILTQRTWVRRYGADPAILGRKVRLNTQQYTVIGVLPSSFDAPIVWGIPEFVLPRTIFADFRTSRTGTWMQAIARLKPGVSLAQAQSEVDTIAARLAKAHPMEDAGRGLRLNTLHDSNLDKVSRSLLWLMTGISLTMLLIACANLASLEVARAFGRSREFAVRASLGATRWQLMSPLLAESMLLSLAGGIGGLFVASWSNHIIGSLLLINNEPGYEIPIDGRVLLFSAFAAILSGVAFGLAPAWLSARAPAAEALKEGSRGATASRSHHRLKNSLIVIELALALALVGTAASFGFGTKSFLKREVGWDTSGLFEGFVAMPYNRYTNDDQVRTFQRALLDRLATIPGIEHPTLADGLPVYSLSGGVPIAVEGRPAEESGREPLTELAQVSPEYFAALRIPLKRGSLFTAQLTEKDPPVVVINESFAKRFWPGENPIGRRVRLGTNGKYAEIVGVVGDVKMVVRLETPATRLQAYEPMIQHPTHYYTIVARSKLDPDAITKSVREAVAAVDPDLPVARPGSLQAHIERGLANLDLVVVNLGISAGMGLLIAGVGLFGVISQLMQQRTRDIGVRMALGAREADIMGLILGEGLKLLVVGIAVGLIGYYLLNVVLHRAMPEMQLPGLWLLLVNLAVLSSTMLLACYLPARRAARINPVDALRAD